MGKLSSDYKNQTRKKINFILFQQRGATRALQIRGMEIKQKERKFSCNYYHVDSCNYYYVDRLKYKILLFGGEANK